MLVGIVTIVIATIAVLNHHLAWLLAIFPGLYILYAFLIAYSKAPSLKDEVWHGLSVIERQAWRRYHVALRFGKAAPVMSRTLTTLQVLSVVTGVAFLITGFYWGGLLIAGWFVLGLATPRLNPTLYLNDAANRGDAEAIAWLEALEALHDKLR